MPGRVTLLTNAKVSGWAIHPYLQDYSVIVHVIYKSRVLCSSIANQPAPPTESENTNSWFNIGLADFRLLESDLRNLSFLVGETDELLDVSFSTYPKDSLARNGIIVEDIINANVKRRWVTGATYVEAVQAGLTDSDIIDLFYRDILGRPADPDGLASYLFQRREGIKTLNDIRKGLLDSEEYSKRQKDAAHAPGAVFSQPIALLAGTLSTEMYLSVSSVVDEVQDKDGQMDIRAISWPSYPERHVAKPTRENNEILEVTLPLDSVLFGTGWHNVEYSDLTAFRWMETTGVIFSPRPELPCVKIILKLAAVYGSSEPMIDCYMDDNTSEVQVEKLVDGFLIVVSPLHSVATAFTKLRIESRTSGCPLQENRGTDQRILSLDLLSAIIEYQSLNDLDEVVHSNLS